MSVNVWRSVNTWAGSTPPPSGGDMGQVNDCRVDLGRSRLSETTGQINDLERAWLAMQSVSSLQYSDAWFEYLGNQGFSGTYNDRWFTYLGSLGATGTLSDRVREAFCNNLFSPPVSSNWILDTGSWDDTKVWVDTETWRDN